MGADQKAAECDDLKKEVQKKISEIPAAVAQHSTAVKEHVNGMEALARTARKSRSRLQAVREPIREEVTGIFNRLR